MKTTKTLLPAHWDGYRRHTGSSSGRLRRRDTGTVVHGWGHARGSSPWGRTCQVIQSSARTSHVTLRPLQGAYAKANGLEQKPPKCPSTDGWSNTGAAHVGTSSALQRTKVLTPYMDDEPRKYHAKSSKPDTKGHTLYGSIYVRDSK